MQNSCCDHRNFDCVNQWHFQTLGGGRGGVRAQNNDMITTTWQMGVNGISVAFRHSSSVWISMQSTSIIYSEGCLDLLLTDFC